MDRLLFGWKVSRKTEVIRVPRLLSINVRLRQLSQLNFGLEKLQPF
jgi:hypothetical protein